MMSMMKLIIVVGIVLLCVSADIETMGGAMVGGEGGAKLVFTCEGE